MIYLDIDGVLILENENDASKLRERGEHVAWIANRLFMPIVISSQRRISWDVFQVIEAAGLLEHTIVHPELWRTPLRLENPDDNLSIRGQEIEAHRHAMGIGPHLIIDDSPVLASQTHLAIDPSIGLDHPDRVRALALFDDSVWTVS